jgi:hypothetical protein
VLRADTDEREERDDIILKARKDKPQALKARNNQNCAKHLSPWQHQEAGQQPVDASTRLAYHDRRSYSVTYTSAIVNFGRLACILAP